ncbi:MAG: hypothetical protein GXP55_24655 [Deltaproteobacteria bacterium]|nr:hypothetical protein [Deltaproteobacteria bacterium]
MAIPPFDPGDFFHIDLAHGAMNTRGGQRVLVLSDTVVAPLVSAAVQNGDLTALRELGRVVGAHVESSLGGSPRAASAEDVLGHARAALALFGWGRLCFERWGEALVASLSGLPRLDEDHLGVAALLGGLVSALAEAEVACVPVGDDRFLVVDPSVAEQIWTWSREGADLATLVAHLAAPEAA